MQVTINGKPLTASWQQIVLVLALTLGGFTTGAAYPELSPLGLIESKCAE